MPKVSVLIPAYNVEPYIEECINSVLQQTLQDFEIICIDDKSTDGTLSILRDYEKLDDRVHVYCHEQNKGQACGRNHALEHATGEYVYMLDADDKIIPEALEELYALCSKEQLDLVGFETMNFAEDDRFQANVRIKTISYQNTETLNGRQALTYCMDTETFSLSTPTFMMCRAYLMDRKIRFVEGILHEDVGYIFELILRADRVRFLHKIYFLRRIRAHSTMTVGFTAKNIEGYIKSFYKSFELEPEYSGYFAQEPAFEKAYRKWQRDIFGRMNQLYTQSAEAIAPQSGGNVDEQIRRSFEMVKLFHWRLPDLKISECYICGCGQYAERALTAVGAQDILIRGVILPEKTRRTFHGFPVLLPEEVQKGVPVIMSLSHYTENEMTNALEKAGITELIHLQF